MGWCIRVRACGFYMNHITSCDITSHRITSRHITSHHTMSYHMTWYDMTSYHITSYHITSHHITSQLITPHRNTGPCGGVPSRLHSKTVHSMMRNLDETRPGFDVMHEFSGTQPTLTHLPVCFPMCTLNLFFFVYFQLH